MLGCHFYKEVISKVVAKLGNTNTGAYISSSSDGLVHLQGPEDLRGAEHHLPRPLLHPLATGGLNIGLPTQSRNHIPTTQQSRTQILILTLKKHRKFKVMKKHRKFKVKCYLLRTTLIFQINLKRMNIHAQQGVYVVNHCALY